MIELNGPSAQALAAGPLFAGGRGTAGLRPSRLCFARLCSPRLGFRIQPQYSTSEISSKIQVRDATSQFDFSIRVQVLKLASQFSGHRRIPLGFPNKGSKTHSAMSAVRGSLGPSYLQPGGSRSITSRPSQVTSRAAPATSGARGKRAVKASARSSPSGALAPEPLAGAPDRFLEAQAQDLSVQESAQYGHCTDTVGQSVQGAAAPVSRRGVMAAPLAQLLAGAVAPIVTSMASIVTSTVAFPPLPALATVTPARIDASTQPSASFDPTDEGLRRAAEVFQSALDAKSVRTALSPLLPPAPSTGHPTCCCSALVCWCFNWGWLAAASREGGCLLRNASRLIQ